MRRGIAATILYLAATISAACEPAPPDPLAVARAYAKAWSALDYAGMWQLLSPDARTQVGEDGFLKRLPRIAEEMSLTSVDVTVGPVSRPRLANASPDPRRATVPLMTIWHTKRVGDFSREVTLDLRLAGEGEAATWRVAWTTETLLPRLTAGRLIRMTRVSTSRGRILARDGTELATFVDATVVGIVPGQMRSEPATVASVASVLGTTPEAVRAKLAQPWVRPDVFVPIRTLTPAETTAARARLVLIEGVQLQVARTRNYPTGLASQTLGWLAEASEAEAGKKSARGVEAGDLVGKAGTGLEDALDDVLGGAFGWRLGIVENDERPVETLGETAAVPGADVVLAIDIAMQKAAEEKLGEQKGAVVAEDPWNGEILALASRPSFDLNAVVSGDSATIAKLQADARRPFFGRATFGQYPTGSSFKPVTAAAALRAGVYRSGERIDCPFRWTGYGPGWVQINHEAADIGLIDLRTALARSCNSFFYELGKRLNDKDRDLLPVEAQSFGLGKATDIDYVFEASGIVPSPDWKARTFANDPSLREWNPGDATNLAIGQGFLLATPLQMANYAAALANDGIVWKPRLVIEIRDRTGKLLRAFPKTQAGRALTTPTDLSLIRDGMRAVVTDPLGTVYFPFRTFTIAAAGKSGTAETSAGPPDAWFIGFAPFDAPSVAIATVFEEKPGLLGSQDAAVVSRAVFGAKFGVP